MGKELCNRCSGWGCIECAASGFKQVPDPKPDANGDNHVSGSFGQYITTVLANVTHKTSVGLTGTIPPLPPPPVAPAIPPQVAVLICSNGHRDWELYIPAVHNSGIDVYRCRPCALQGVTRRVYYQPDPVVSKASATP